MVVGHLAAQASTHHGRDRCLEVPILTHSKEVEEALALTQEARDLAGLSSGFPLGGMHDLRTALRRVEQGGSLDAKSLVEIADTLEGAKRLKGFLAGHAERFPKLAELEAPLAPQPDLVKELRRCLEPGGQVKDAASPPLGGIRSAIGSLQGKIKHQVQRLLSSNASYLQEALVTVRGDRYVLPVRAEFKSKVPGLVHDSSASGQTLFIEPMVLVDLNNQLQEARLEERDEIARILLVLSELVAEVVLEIRVTTLGIAEIDFVVARARLSERWNGYGPKVQELGEKGFRLYKARHPLLVEASLTQPDRGVVPIDLVTSKPALLITGPNTGGKTVTLKTLGLCTLLAQAGIHPPVGQGSRLTLFAHIFADIGDEQSLAQSLSTFSGHMRNLIRLLEQADARTLVLLDEVGAGTDPAEGAAIARALIEELLRRGTRLVATTHLGELKLLPYAIAEVENGSVEFDSETMRPTYRLLVGVPGHSNAIAIARRLGFPTRLAARAEILMAEGGDESARLVSDLSREKHDAASKALASDEARERAEALEAEYRAKLAGWGDERKLLKEEARREVAAALEEAHDEIREAIRELKIERTPQAAQRSGDKLRRLASKLRPAEPERAPLRVQVGETVFVPRLGQNGIVQALPDEHGELVLQIGLIKVTAKVSEVIVGPPPPGASKRKREPALERIAPSLPTMRGARGLGVGESTPRQASRELDVRGLQVHEALPKVEQFLDQGLESGLETLFLIHGAGTGALRRAIREYLSDSPYTQGFRAGGQGEGGDGVTVVTLR